MNAYRDEDEEWDDQDADIYDDSEEESAVPCPA
jgi:hypothetical protein